MTSRSTLVSWTAVLAVALACAVCTYALEGVQRDRGTPPKRPAPPPQRRPSAPRPPQNQNPQAPSRSSRGGASPSNGNKPSWQDRVPPTQPSTKRGQPLKGNRGIPQNVHGRPGATPPGSLSSNTFPPSIDPSLHNFGLPHRITDIVEMQIRMEPVSKLVNDHDVPQPTHSEPGDGRRGFTGNLTIALFGDTVPKTVENFKLLCKGGAAIETGARHEGYSGSIFHRIIRNFIVQGGDFEFNDGFGGYAVLPQDQLHPGSEAGPGQKRRYLADENFILRHRPGSVAMAAHDAHTNGAQFYILLDGASAPDLDGRHVVFGQVLQGFATTLQTISRAPTDDAQRPLAPVSIIGCDVKPFIVATETHHNGTRLPDPNKLEPGTETEEELAAVVEQGPRRLHDPPRRSKRAVLEARAKFLEQEEARRKAAQDRQRRGAERDNTKPRPRGPRQPPKQEVKRGEAAESKGKEEGPAAGPRASASESKTL